MAEATVPQSRFARPRGLLGSLAGRAMAVLNADMAREAVGLLTLGGGEAVLDIGFGPGVSVAEALSRLPEGRVAGVDPSEVMVAQAHRRNREAVAEGRADLRLGYVSTLPWADEAFDAACSLNAVQLWDLDADLDEVRRVLVAGGQLALGVHEWAGKAHGGAPDRDLENEVPFALEQAGFCNVAKRRTRARSGVALYFHAWAPPSFSNHA